MSLVTKISEVGSLPTLPTVVADVERVATSMVGNAQALADVISQDPPLAAKLLKMANSAFYTSTGARISSIPLAVARIGVNEIRHLSITMGVLKAFEGPKVLLNYPAFWHHSLLVACLTQQIAIRTSEVYDDAKLHHYFMAGLLHDVGILLYDQKFPQEFALVVAGARESAETFLQAEARLAPKETHALMGGLLLEFWKMDSSVIASIRHHHEPTRAQQNFEHITHSLACAEALCAQNDKKTFEGISPFVFESSCEKIGLTAIAAQSVWARANQDVLKFTDVV